MTNITSPETIGDSMKTKLKTVTILKGVTYALVLDQEYWLVEFDYASDAYKLKAGCNVLAFKKTLKQCRKHIEELVEGRED